MTNDLENYDAVVQVIARIEDRIATVDDIATALGILKTRKDQLSQITALLEDAMLKHIIATGESITVGMTRYYAGVDKVTKCKDPRALLETMLGLDIDTAADCLSANAWKPGQCREALGDAWHEHFEVTERDRLKEGKPQRTLQKADIRFAG